MSGPLHLAPFKVNPLCRILTAWFPTRERGTWWGFWTASNNIGGFAAPLIAGGAANRFGWRWGSHP